MRIDCPHCGARDQGEFIYLGDAAPKRPSESAPAAEMFAYVYLRDNPAGVIREHWYHAGGCRAWLAVTRDVRTHAIAAVTPARTGDSSDR
ncbi:MAG: sarcosine oxidase subunit delta [Hyphomicrobiaceae bacterium]